jgi:hypothetical protein
VVVQHELRCGEIRLTLDSDLVGIMGELGALDLLHDGELEEGSFVTVDMAS